MGRDHVATVCASACGPPPAVCPHTTSGLGSAGRPASAHPHRVPLRLVGRTPRLGRGLHAHKLLPQCLVRSPPQRLQRCKRFCISVFSRQRSSRLNQPSFCASLQPSFCTSAALIVFESAQPAQPAQPAQQSSPRSPGSRSAGGRQGGRGDAGGGKGRLNFLLCCRCCQVLLRIFFSAFSGRCVTSPQAV
jgi:hypothetical protein